MGQTLVVQPATPPAIHARYAEWMGGALSLAVEAAAGGDVPVGAVVVDAAGTIIGSGYNEREAGGDPLAHAEVSAIRQAAAQVGTWRLDDCTLVVTLEPCAMCAGAAAQARVGRIVLGAWDPKAGACGSVWDIARSARAPHWIEVVGGIREDECAALLKDFFAARRRGVG